MKLKINHTTDHTSKGACPSTLPSLSHADVDGAVDDALQLPLLSVPLSFILSLALFHILVVVINCFVAALIDAPRPDAVIDPSQLRLRLRPSPLPLPWSCPGLPVGSLLGHGPIIEICYVAWRSPDQRVRRVQVEVCCDDDLINSN